MYLQTNIKNQTLKIDHLKTEQDFIHLLQRADLDRQIAEEPSLIESFDRDLESVLSDTFKEEPQSPLSQFLLQRILYRINRLKLFWYDDLKNYTNEDSLFLLKVRNRIESPWQAWESNCGEYDSLQLVDVGEGLQNRVARDLDPEDSTDGLFFREEMTETGYRRLLAIASLDGLVEASQLSRVLGGAANEIQSMVTRIFLEEYGGGQLRRKHSSFFTAMLDEFGMSSEPEAYLDVVPWEVLANINHSFYLCDRNRHFLRYMGGLLYTEVSVPASFMNFHRAGERLGLSKNAIEYWDLHIKEDKKHGQWMLEDVALPLVKRYPDNAWEILWGYDQQRFLSGRAGRAVADSVKNVEKDYSPDSFFNQY